MNLKSATREDRLLAAYLAAVVLGYAALTLLGITQSSIGIGGLQTSGTTSEDVSFGSPRPIRGDEFSRGSPLVLGEAATGGGEFTSPLGEDPTITSGTVTAGAVERLVFLERALIQATTGLPDDIRFAAYWWLWIAVAALFLPVLLRLWNVPLGISLLTTTAILVNPANAWWSNTPVQSVALASVVAATIGLAWKKPSRWRPAWLALLAVVGSLALARLPFAYLPFSFPIAAAIVVPTFMLGLSKKTTRKTTLVFSGTIILVAATLALLVLSTNRPAFEALTSTLYPGERRVSGQLLNLGFVFGAPFLGLLQSNAELIGTNQSELSTGWSFLAVAALVIATATRALRPSRAAYITLGVVLTCMFSWVLYSWPVAWGGAIPIANSIPPSRLAAVIGVPAALAAALALSAIWRNHDLGRDDRIRTVGGTAISTAFVLLIAGSTLQATYLPTLSSTHILVASLIATSCVAALMAKPNWLRGLGAALAVVGMAATVWRAAPVMDGLGDLRGSAAAETLVSLAGDRDPVDGYWAADSWNLNALLTANGIPSLSGDQWTGPTDLWLTLDPDREYEQAWNRGATVIYFRWDTAAAEPTISTPQADQVVITVSPCDPALADLGLKFVVTPAQLEAPCLSQVAQFQYAGLETFVYSVDAAG